MKDKGRIKQIITFFFFFCVCGGVLGRVSAKAAGAAQLDSLRREKQ